MAAQDWAKQLLVNMKHVKYLSSTGFAVLLKLVKQARDQGTKVKFSNLDPEVRIGADIIGLDQVAASITPNMRRSRPLRKHEPDRGSGFPAYLRGFSRGEARPSSVPA